MTSTPHAVSWTNSEASASDSLVGLMEDIKPLSVACDTMCLDAGARLCDAVPILGALSSGFGSLAEMLDRPDVFAATATLERVSTDVAIVGRDLTTERIALEKLAELAQNLSRQIIDVASDVRIISAIVPYVKMEIATLDPDGDSLKNFALGLERLAASAIRTINDFRDTHQDLIAKLADAVEAETAFERSHGTKLVAVGRDIEAALAILSVRRRSVSSASSEIGVTAQAISAQVAQSVVALQVGDSTRQRIEHVENALMLTEAVVSETGFEGIELSTEDIGSDPARQSIIARICGLQTILLTDAADDFQSEISTISTLLERIAAAVESLLSRSNSLFGSDAASSRSFVGDLENNLDAARKLIEACRQSRAVVDRITGSLLPAIQALERLASTIATMSAEMTIIGTNAIVTAHRLGSRGGALGIIAQDLRSHALRIADVVARLSPALGTVLLAAEAFRTARADKESVWLETIADNMVAGLSVFGACDKGLGDMQLRLQREATAVRQVLELASSRLDGADDVHAKLHEAAMSLGRITRPVEDERGSRESLISIARHLRRQYTMAAERDLHDTFFSDLPPDDRVRDSGTEMDGVQLFVDEF